MSSNYEEAQKMILKQCQEYCSSEISLFHSQKAQVDEELRAIIKLERKLSILKDAKLKSFIKLGRGFDSSRVFCRQGKIEHSPIAEPLCKMCTHILQKSNKNPEILNDFDCVQYMSTRPGFGGLINQLEVSRTSGDLILYIKELNKELVRLQSYLKSSLKIEIELARCSAHIKTSQNQLAVCKSKLMDKMEQYITETKNFDYEDFLISEIIK